MNIDWTEFNRVKNPCNVYYLRDDTVVATTELQKLLQMSMIATDFNLRDALQELLRMKTSQQFFVPKGVNVFYRHFGTGRHLTVAYSYDKETGQVNYNFVMYRPDTPDIDDWDKESHRFSAMKRLQKKPLSFQADKCMKHSDLRKLIRSRIAKFGRTPQ